MPAGSDMRSAMNVLAESADLKSTNTVNHLDVLAVNRE
jgi:hypothetical protein